MGGLLLLGSSVGEARELCLVLGSVGLSPSTPFGGSIPATPGAGAEDAGSPELSGEEVFSLPGLFEEEEEEGAAAATATLAFDCSSFNNPTWLEEVGSCCKERGKASTSPPLLFSGGEGTILSVSIEGVGSETVLTPSVPSDPEIKREKERKQREERRER